MKETPAALMTFHTRLWMVKPSPIEFGQSCLASGRVGRWMQTLLLPNSPSSTQAHFVWSLIPVASLLGSKCFPLQWSFSLLHIWFVWFPIPHKAIFLRAIGRSKTFLFLRCFAHFILWLFFPPAYFKACSEAEASVGSCVCVSVDSLSFHLFMTPLATEHTFRCLCS